MSNLRGNNDFVDKNVAEMSSLVEKHTFTVVQMLVETGTVTKSGKQFEVDAMVVPHAWVIENGWMTFLASCGIDHPMEPGIGKDLVYFPSGIRIHGLMRVATSVPDMAKWETQQCKIMRRNFAEYREVCVFFNASLFFIIIVSFLFYFSVA